MNPAGCPTQWWGKIVAVTCSNWCDSLESPFDTNYCNTGKWTLHLHKVRSDNLVNQGRNPLNKEENCRVMEKAQCVSSLCCDLWAVIVSPAAEESCSLWVEEACTHRYEAATLKKKRMCVSWCPAQGWRWGEHEMPPNTRTTAELMYSSVRFESRHQRRTWSGWVVMTEGRPLWVTGGWAQAQHKNQNECQFHTHSTPSPIFGLSSESVGGVRHCQAGDSGAAHSAHLQVTPHRPHPSLFNTV